MKHSQLLLSLRTALLPPPPVTGLPHLDALIGKHSGAGTAKPRLTISGRGLPLLYHIISTLVTSFNGTVAVIDLEGRFSPSHLRCDLNHVYIFRAIPSIRGGTGGAGSSIQAYDLKKTLENVEKYMLYGDHKSREREWVGTMVNGAVGGDISVVWNGWLSVDREEVARFPVGMNIEEALEDREKRQGIVDEACWRGTSRSGWYSWKEK